MNKPLYQKLRVNKVWAKYRLKNTVGIEERPRLPVWLDQSRVGWTRWWPPGWRRTLGRSMKPEWRRFDAGVEMTKPETRRPLELRLKPLKRSRVRFLPKISVSGDVLQNALDSFTDNQHWGWMLKSLQRSVALIFRRTRLRYTVTKNGKITRTRNLAS